MNSDALKRILLIMGVKDPAIKMSVRHIMNRMDSNADLASVFAYRPRTGSDVPKTVKRYVDEHLEKGSDEGEAWALAWSRYCKYKNPGSPRCKQDDYFSGKGGGTLAARVAYAWVRNGYIFTLPSKIQQHVFVGVQKLVRAGLSPFPATDPQRLETQLAQWVRSEVQDYLRDRSFAPDSAHEFVRAIIREAEVSLSGNVLERVVSDAGGDVALIDRQMMGRLDSILNEMANGLADDASRGSLRGQKQAIRLFIRSLGMEEWEAQQLLDGIASEVKINVPLAPDQVDLILTSYLD